MNFSSLNTHEKMNRMFKINKSDKYRIEMVMIHDTGDMMQIEKKKLTKYRKKQWKFNTGTNSNKCFLIISHEDNEKYF